MNPGARARAFAFPSCRCACGRVGVEVVDEEGVDVVAVDEVVGERGTCSGCDRAMLCIPMSETRISTYGTGPPSPNNSPRGERPSGDDITTR